VDNFVHLHVHDEYSPLDGAANTEELVLAAKSLGQHALAQTNHGNLFGSYNFHKACRTHGITPIIGLEAYVAPADRTHKSKVHWGTNDEGREAISGGGAYTHLTLLATGSTGVRNLFRLSSQSFTDGFYSKPRIDLDLLGSLSEGLVVGSGCLSGELLTRLSLGQREEAQAYVVRMKEMLGDNFFIEVMDHGFDRESMHLRTLSELAKQYGVRMVATNDSHYVAAGDALLHDAMLCLQTFSKLTDDKRMRFDGSGYYIKSRREMAALELPEESLDNTLWVAEQVTDVSDVFAHRDGMPKWDGDAEAELRAKIDGWLSGRPSEYTERATYELDVICTQGFADYFLVYADIIEFAKSKGISVGPGRGSAAGSVVAFALGITGIDPIHFGLLFERFLNKDRVSLPDIDVDFQASRRDEVYEYAINKYGADRCARILTVLRIEAKSALNDSARILGRPYGAGEELARALPREEGGRTPKLAEADLRHVSDTETWDLATRLEGLARGTGVHPSAFIISPVPLTDVLPTFVPSRDSDAVATQFDMHAVEALGLVKFDLLGLKTLDVIESAIGHGAALPSGLEDVQTYSALSTGEALGCFQLDSPGMRSLLKRMGPRSVHDIAACIALYRPGPMGTDSHSRYADRRNGKEMVSYPHPDIASTVAPALAPTYGVVVYQEQVMQVLQLVCGYSLSQADVVRKIMGKKDRVLLAKERDGYLERSSKAGLSQESALALWDVLVPFADYGFNKSHAYGYAILSFWTAYLKTHYPREWMASLLSYTKTPEKLTEYLGEVERMRIPILPPDINGGASWTPTKEGIRYGIQSIRGVGPKVTPSLLRSAPYTSYDDFLQRAPKAALNVGVLKALAYSGALDSLGGREGLLEVLQSDAEKVVSDRANRRRGEVGFGRRRFLAPDLPVDWDLRERQEHSVLGVGLSVPDLVLQVPEGLSHEEWEYVRRAVDVSPGRSPITFRQRSWTYRTGVAGHRESLVRALVPLGIHPVE